MEIHGLCVILANACLFHFRWPSQMRSLGSDACMFWFCFFVHTCMYVLTEEGRKLGSHDMLNWGGRLVLYCHWAVISHMCAEVLLRDYLLINLFVSKLLKTTKLFSNNNALPTGCSIQLWSCQSRRTNLIWGLCQDYNKLLVILGYQLLQTMDPVSYTSSNVSVTITKPFWMEIIYLNTVASYGIREGKRCTATLRIKIRCRSVNWMGCTEVKETHWQHTLTP